MDVQQWLLSAHTTSMETAITLPDDTVARSTKRAAELHIAPNDLIAAAVAHYLAYLDSLSLTRDMDQLLAEDAA